MEEYVYFIGEDNNLYRTKYHKFFEIYIVGKKIWVKCDNDIVFNKNPTFINKEDAYDYILYEEGMKEYLQDPETVSFSEIKRDLDIKK